MVRAHVRNRDRQDCREHDRRFQQVLDSHATVYQCRIVL
jgi:hypothetical protein